MTFLTNDPLTQLAFSIYENRGVFALLIGSGLSRSAEIPTGWEITIDLIRRVATAQGVASQPDWATWYRKEFGSDPNYSELLEKLAASPDERRSILHSYIEPTQEDRNEDRKIPTPAHRAIAELVRLGYVRVLITTNFDRLLENALRERGVEPTVVASIDALSGAEPIIHSSCYVLKLHGDYKDSRILNTDAELNGYPPEYNSVLDRIFDEHGLLVCGWSGEWDHALRSAVLRAPNRRYSTYWATRSPLTARAQELVDHRRAQAVSISDADSFFQALLGRIQTLEQSHRLNPLSVELLVNSTKRLLAKSEFRIQLDEMFSQEASRVISQLNGSEFNMPGSFDKSVFRSFVKRYESVAEPLSCMAGVLGRWGDGNDFPVVADILHSLYLHSQEPKGGLTIFLNIRSYPAVLVFTAYGLGLIRSKRFYELHRLFDVILEKNLETPHRAVSLLFLSAWAGTEHDAWKQIEGLEQRKTPLSDHLFGIYSEWGKTFIGLMSGFEQMFDLFETLGSLAYLERVEKADLRSGLAAPLPGSFSTWMPVGRASWKRRGGKELIEEITTEPMKTALTKAGFGKGDPEFIDLFAMNFQIFASRMAW